MDNPPLVVEDEFCGLHEISVAFPSGTKEVGLFLRHPIGQLEGLAFGQLNSLLLIVHTGSNNGRIQPSERVGIFSEAI